MSDNEWENGPLDDWESDLDDFSMESPDSKGRTPIEQASRMVGAGIGATAVPTTSAMASIISKAMPKTAAIANDGMALASDILTMKDEFQKDIGPTINSLKITARKFLPKAKKLIPEKLYDKIDKKLDVHQGERVRTPEERLEESRDAVITGAIGSIFQKQEAANEAERTEGRVDKLIDRKLESTRHEKSMSINAMAYGEQQKLTAFNEGVLSEYLKKSLELKYKHLFVAKDTLGLTKALFTMAEVKLEEIKINTSLPDIQKQRKTESIKAAMRGKMAESFTTYAGQFGKRMLDNVKTKVLDKVKSGLGEAATMGDMMASMQDMQADMGIKPDSLSAKAAKFGLGAVGKLAGSTIGKKVVDVAQPLIQDFEGTSNNYKTKGILKIDELKDKYADKPLGKLLDFLAPTFDNTTATTTDLLSAGEEPASFDVLARQTLVEIIPGYLSKQLKQLTDIATGKDSDELVYDLTNRDFSTVQQLRENIGNKTFGTKEDRAIKLGEATGVLRGAFDTNKDDTAGSFEAVNKDIGRVLRNLAYNTKMLQPAEFKEFSESEEGIESASSYIEKALDGTSDPKAVAAAITQALHSGSNIDNSSLNAINDKIIDLMGDDKYRSTLPALFDTAGYTRFFKDDVDEYGNLTQASIVGSQVDVDDESYDLVTQEAGIRSSKRIADRHKTYDELEAKLKGNKHTAKYADVAKQIQNDPTQLIADLKATVTKALSANTKKLKERVGIKTEDAVTELPEQVDGEEQAPATIKETLLNKVNDTKALVKTEAAKRGLPITKKELIDRVPTSKEELTKLGTSIKADLTTKAKSSKLIEKAKDTKAAELITEQVDKLKQSKYAPTAESALADAIEVKDKVKGLTKDDITAKLTSIKANVDDISKEDITNILAFVKDQAVTDVTAITDKVKGISKDDITNTLTSAYDKASSITKEDIKGVLHSNIDKLKESKHAPVIANLATDATVLKDKVLSDPNVAKTITAAKEVKDKVLSEGTKLKDDAVSKLEDSKHAPVITQLQENMTTVADKVRSISKEDIKDTLVSTKDKVIDKAKAIPQLSMIKDVVSSGRVVTEAIPETTEPAEPTIDLRDMAKSFSPILLKKISDTMDTMVSLPELISTTPAIADTTETPVSTEGSDVVAEIISFKETVMEMGISKAERDNELITLMRNLSTGVDPSVSTPVTVDNTESGLVKRGLSKTKDLAVGGAKAYGNLMGKIYGAAGNVASSGLNLATTAVPGMLGLAGKTVEGGFGLAGKAVGMYKDIGTAGFGAVKSIFGSGTVEDEPFVNIYIKDDVDPSNPILSSRKQKQGDVIYEDGSIVERSSDIVEPVFDGETKEAIITQEDLDKGLVDINNKPLGSVTKAVGSPKLNKLGKLGGGVKDLATKGLSMIPGLGGSVLGMYSSMFKTAIGAGGALLSKGKDILSKSNDLEKEDLDPIMERMDTIIQIMEDSRSETSKEEPEAKKLLGDADGDGDRDGSYKDLMAKAKDKKATKAAKAAGILGAVRGRSRGPVGTQPGEDDSPNTLVEMAKYKALDKGAGILGKAGRFLGSKGGTLAKGALTLGSGALMAGGSALASGAAAAGGMALSAGAAAGTAAIAGLAAIPVAGWIALGVGAVGYGAYKFFSKDGSSGSIELLKQRMKYYGVPDSVDVDDVRALEDDTYEIIQGEREPLSRGEMEDYCDDFGLDEDDERHVSGFKEWYQKKFIPLFGQFLMAAKNYGKSYADMEDIDDEDPIYKDLEAMMVKSMGSAKVTELTIDAIMTPVTKKAKKDKAKKAKSKQAPDTTPKSPTGKMATDTTEPIPEADEGLWGKVKRIGKATLAATPTGMAAKYMIDKFKDEPEVGPHGDIIEQPTSTFDKVKSLGASALSLTPTIAAAKYMADKFKDDAGLDPEVMVKAHIEDDTYGDTKVVDDPLSPEEGDDPVVGQPAKMSKMDSIISKLDVIAPAILSPSVDDDGKVTTDKLVGVASPAIGDNVSEVITKDEVVKDTESIDVAKAIGATQVEELSAINSGISTLARLMAASLDVNNSMNKHLKTTSEKNPTNIFDQKNVIVPAMPTNTETTSIAPAIDVGNK